MAESNGRMFAVSMFLVGVVLSGAVGVARSDFLGEKAAIEVKVELKEDIKAEERHRADMERRWEARFDRFEQKLDRVLESQ